MTRILKPKAILGWLAICILCALRTVGTPEADVHLIEPATNFSEGLVDSVVWTAPVVSMGWLPNGLIVPEWFAAVLAASLIWLITGAFTSGDGLIQRMVAAILLSCVWSADSLLLWVWLSICLTAFPSKQGGRIGPRQWLISGLALLGSVFTCIDFALVAVLAITLALDDCCGRSQQVPESRIGFRGPAFCLVIVMGLSAASVWSDAFQRALMRPLTGIELAMNSGLYPNLEFIVRKPVECLNLAAAVLFFVGRRTRTDEFRFLAPITALAFVSLAICCRGYLSIATVVLVLVPNVRLLELKNPIGTSTKPASSWLLATVGCLLFIVVGATGFELRESVFSNPFQRRLVDLSSIQAPCNVLVTTPETARYWQGPEAPKNSRLVFSHRWDTLSVSKSIAVERGVSDLLRGRRERYQRQDGTWGGTRDDLDTWSADLIAIDSSDWAAIRQLSVNPNWNVIAIDGQQTVFASAKQPAFQRRAQEAGRLWFFLEWPNPNRRVQVETFLEPGLEEDSIRIAGVMNAMRLPYAALRVLPDASGAEADFQRAWSYTELATRCARQNGVISLYDQARAHRLIDSLTERNVPPNRLQPLLNSLKAAVRLCSGPESQETKIAANQIRYFLASGEFLEAQKAFGRLTDQEKNAAEIRFLQVFLNARAAELPLKVSSLQETAANLDASMSLVQEALFYLGCHHLEARQIMEAVQCFAQVMNSENPDQRRVLCGLYLQQLTQ